MKLYNTLTRKLETVEPIHPPKVGLYTCGPTVYNFVHLGNLRTYLFEDILRRTLTFNRFEVKHVMNITDVGHLTNDSDSGDDKMEESAKSQGKNAYDLATFYTEAFKRDLVQLNILPADIMPTATGTIDLQIKLIQKLEAKGVTYKTSDGIYFDTAKFPGYGQLSKQKLSDKQAGARVEVNSEKRNPTDFALWKFSPSGSKRQMEWPSPWGVGFPGWHIECSAMSMHELGEQFDIHTGGIDHIAVHHENEIAQSEAATGKIPFVKYWLHGEFLVLPDKRMGKSEGNFITLQTVLDRKIPALAYRYLVLQTHYRQKLTFSWNSLEAAAQGLNRVWATIDSLESAALTGQTATSPDHLTEFSAAVNDDLNTPRAVAVLHDLLKADLPSYIKRNTLRQFDSILGLDLLGLHQMAWINPPTPKIAALMEERQQARDTRDWEKADQLRDQLKQAGLDVVDTPEGQRLRKV